MKRLKGRSVYIIRLAKVVQAAGGTAQFVARCKAAKLSSVWVRLGYGPRLDPNLRLPEFAAIQTALRTAGIEVWGWHIPRCPGLERAKQEAGLVVEWSRRYGLDGVLLDAENGDLYFQGGEEEADLYGREVRSGLSALGCGLALSSHDQPRGFPDFPFAVLLRHVEDNSPQVYYGRDVEGRLGRSVRQYRTLETARDFADRYKPVGNITMRGDVAHETVPACLARAEEFIALVAAGSYKAYSFWCWDEAPDEIWPFLEATDVFPRVQGPAAAAAAPSAEAISEAELAGLADDVLTLGSVPEDERSDYYDEVVAPQLEEYGLRVRDGTDTESLQRWLRIQSLTLNLAVEGIADVTFHIWQRSRADVEAALTSLPVETQARVGLLLREFEGEDAIPPGLLQRFSGRALSHPPGELAPGGGGVLGAFVGEDTSRSARGFPVVRGTFTLFDEVGARLASYATNSGGGARNHRARNGPTPPGLFRVSNHRPGRTTAGMVLHGVGYSFDVDPVDGTPVYGRSLFRIHPDGGSPQTNGCLGIRESAAKLREAEDIILDLMRRNGDRFRISIRHDT